VLAFGGTLLGICLGSTRVLTFHEVIFAQPAREMLATGDWLMPRFAGVPSTHKPPLTHWLIAASMALTGQRGGEWAPRLAILAVSLLTAWLVASLAASWHGRRVGLAAGMVQCSAFYVLMQARLAEADMVLCAAVTAALYCFARAVLDEDQSLWSRRAWTWSMYACAGLAFLTKFVIGPAFVFGACVVYALWRREKQALRPLLSPVGWVVLLAVALPWPILAWRAHPPILDDWITHNVLRFSGRMKGRNEPWLYFLYMAPAILLPWTPWLLGAIWYGGVRQRLLAERRWALAMSWFLAGLLGLSLSAYKSKHYIIPAMPGLSILCGWFLVQDAWGHVSPRLRPAVVGGVVAVACLAGGVAVWQLRPELIPETLVLIGLVGGAVLLAVFHDARRRPVATLASLFSAFWLVGVGVQCFVIEHFDSYRHLAELGQEVAAGMRQRQPGRPGEDLVLLGLPEDQITYYLPLGITRVDHFKALRALWLSRRPHRLYVVARQHNRDKLAALGRVEVLATARTVRPPHRGQGPVTWMLLERRALPSPASRSASGPIPG